MGNIISRVLRGKRYELIILGRAIKSLFTNRTLYNSPQCYIEKLSLLKNKFPIKGDTHFPIFVFSIGWRAGSTLLQRIIMTDESVFLWGEPYGPLGIIPSLVRFLSAFDDNWPPKRYFLNDSEAILVKKWIANLYPEPKDLIEGMRKMLLEWLAVPAYRMGYKRWGIKEVRLGASEAFFFRWLFPGSKFITIIRNPINQYASFKGWEPWVEWQNFKVDNVVSYARYWNYLARSWINLPPGFPLRVIKYEDLVTGNVDFTEIEDFLQVKLKPEEALNVHVGKRKKKKKVRSYERWIINRETRITRKHYGY